LGKNGHYRDILLDPDGQWVFLRRTGMSIDLGGIGKGYAVEAARKRLIEKKVSRALINLHSSMAAIGGPWRIGIQDPRAKDKSIGVVELNDGDALSTSGDYERGKHIIDPQTGQPADGLAGVTIIGQDAGLVDGFSTAVFVLGTSEGLRLIEMIPNLSGVIVTKQGDIYRSRGLEFK
jgi:thiamine biosynthesis lipoprotein